jgi:hypothetical protein
MAGFWLLRTGVRQIHSEQKKRKRNKYRPFFQCYNLTSAKLITPKHSERQPRITQDIGKFFIIKTGGSMRRIIRRSVCTAESTTESRNAFSNTFHNDMERRNPYQSKNRRRLPEPTPASFTSPVYNTSYLSGTVKARRYEVRMRQRHMQCEE